MFARRADGRPGMVRFAQDATAILLFPTFLPVARLSPEDIKLGSSGTTVGQQHPLDPCHLVGLSCCNHPGMGS